MDVFPIYRMDRIRRVLLSIPTIYFTTGYQEDSVEGRHIYAYVGTHLTARALGQPARAGRGYLRRLCMYRTALRAPVRRPALTAYVCVRLSTDLDTGLFDAPAQTFSPPPRSPFDEISCPQIYTLLYVIQYDISFCGLCW